jgi:hypothetical protein
VLPAEILKKIDITPRRKKIFKTAPGERVERQIVFHPIFKQIVSGSGKFNCYCLEGNHSFTGLFQLSFIIGVGIQTMAMAYGKIGRFNIRPTQVLISAFPVAFLFLLFIAAPFTRSTTAIGYIVYSSAVFLND